MVKNNITQIDTLSDDRCDNVSYDIVIVGAGLSGSLLALSLLKQNAQLKVLLLDENAQRVEKNQSLANKTVSDKQRNPSFDARCIALNAGSVDILDSLALWSEIERLLWSLRLNPK